VEAVLHKMLGIEGSDSVAGDSATASPEGNDNHSSACCHASAMPMCHVCIRSRVVGADDAITGMPPPPVLVTTPNASGRSMARPTKKRMVYEPVQVSLPPAAPGIPTPPVPRQASV
jgi:hypothetical protein